MVTTSAAPTALPPLGTGQTLECKKTFLDTAAQLIAEQKREPLKQKILNLDEKSARHSRVATAGTKGIITIGAMLGGFRWFLSNPAKFHRNYPKGSPEYKSEDNLVNRGAPALAGLVMGSSILYNTYKSKQATRLANDLRKTLGPDSPLDQARQIINQTRTYDNTRLYDTPSNRTTTCKVVTETTKAPTK